MDLTICLHFKKWIAFFWGGCFTEFGYGPNAATKLVYSRSRNGVDASRPKKKKLEYYFSLVWLTGSLPWAFQTGRLTPQSKGPWGGPMIKAQAGRLICQALQAMLCVSVTCDWTLPLRSHLIPITLMIPSWTLQTYCTLSFRWMSVFHKPSHEKQPRHTDSSVQQRRNMQNRSWLLPMASFFNTLEVFFPRCYGNRPFSVWQAAFGMPRGGLTPWYVTGSEGHTNSETDCISPSLIPHKSILQPIYKSMPIFCPWGNILTPRNKWLYTSR